MHIVDSHCHLDRINLEDFDNNFDNVLNKAYEKNVKSFLCACIDFDNFKYVLELAHKYPNIYASRGLHPVDSAGFIPTVEEIVAVRKLANSNPEFLDGRELWIYKTIITI